MKKSEEFFLNKKFSHIYVERNILKHPLTRKVISKFESAEVVKIDHYKDVFNKTGQLFFLQKKSTKLILAEKKAPFIYRGSHMCDSFGHDNFYYTTSAMNCVYNCDYCYLQGMYNSGNIVVFVNLEDTFKSIKSLSESDKIYVCISYDTDLLAIEYITGFVKNWIEFSSANPNVVIELRTKSANFEYLSGIPSVPQFILSWSLSPDEVISAYEKGTPGLSARLDSIKKAVSNGWQVRLCIDPVIYTPDYKEIYSRMADKINSTIDTKLLKGISTGVFRVPGESLGKMRRNNPESALLAYPFEYDNLSESYTYGTAVKEELIFFINGLFNLKPD